MAALSDGHSISAGTWAIPLAALPTLAVILPAGVKGESNVIVSLVTVDGDLLAEAAMVLNISAPAAVVPQASPPTVTGPAALPASSAERERALGLHAKGVEQLERGNVPAARRFFERAAEAGLAQSAVALAGTYDPDELAKMKVVGLQPDISVARKWYEKARELGAAEASERLRRLGTR
jgi:TPR repeat protein